MRHREDTLALALFCCLALSMPIVSAACIGEPPFGSIPRLLWPCIGDQWTYDGSISLQNNSAGLQDGTWHLTFPLTIRGPARVTGNFTLNKQGGVIFHPPIDLVAWNTTKPTLFTIDGSFLQNSEAFTPSLDFASADNNYIHVLESYPSNWSFPLIQSGNGSAINIDDWNLRDQGHVSINNLTTCLELTNTYIATTLPTRLLISSTMKERWYYVTCYRYAPTSGKKSPASIVLITIGCTVAAVAIISWIRTCLGERKRTAIWNAVSCNQCSCCHADAENKSTNASSVGFMVTSGAETDSLLHFTRDPKLKATPVFASLANSDFGAANPFGDSDDDDYQPPHPTKNQRKQKKKKQPLPTPSTDDSLDDAYFSDPEHAANTIPLQEWNSEPNEGTAAAFVSHEAHRY